MIPERQENVITVDLDLESPEEAELRVSVEAILKRHTGLKPEYEEEPPLLLSPL